MNKSDLKKDAIRLKMIPSIIKNNTANLPDLTELVDFNFVSTFIYDTEFPGIFTFFFVCTVNPLSFISTYATVCLFCNLFLFSLSFV